MFRSIAVWVRLNDTRYMLLDPDKKFMPFAGVPKSADVNAAFLPSRSPILNAYVERFMRSTTSECFDKKMIFGENSLRRALIAFTEHYHHERYHARVGNNVIDFRDVVRSVDSLIQCWKRFGGMLNYSHRDEV